jgi:anti-sigma factor RsiW
MTVAELCSWIAANPEDDREVETIREAIRDLKRSGLLRYRNDDQIVEPTQAAVQAFAVLTL